VAKCEKPRIKGSAILLVLFMITLGDSLATLGILHGEILKIVCCRQKVSLNAKSYLNQRRVHPARCPLATWPSFPCHTTHLVPSFTHPTSLFWFWWQCDINSFGLGIRGQLSAHQSQLRDEEIFHFAEVIFFFLQCLSG
jgi:hypothetical protein